MTTQPVPAADRTDQSAALANALAADLADLAAMLVKHPHLAEHLAPALRELHTVLQRSADPLPQQIVDAALAQGAQETRVPQLDSAWFPGEAVRFREITLVVWLLDPAGFAHVRTDRAHAEAAR